MSVSLSLLDVSLGQDTGFLLLQAMTALREAPDLIRRNTVAVSPYRRC